MRRYYYGWNIVGAALLANMLVVGSTYSAFGLFVKPVSADLGLSRADMNTGLILANIGTALLAPFVGRILDRMPVRRIFVACVLCLGGSLVTLGLSRSLWLDAAVLAVPVAIGTMGAGALTASVLMARWFIAHRGRAMALSAIGMSLGHVVVAPVVGWLIATQGWRNALVVAGAGVSVVLLLLALVIRERPGPNDVEQGGAAAAAAKREEAPAGTPLKVSEILRMPQFWCIALGSALGISVIQALLATMAPLALDGGFSMAQAASLVSVIGIAAIAGKLVLAVVADKFDKLILFTGFLCLGAIVNAGLLMSQEYAFLLGCAALIGLTSAALSPVLYALLADRFGAPSFGTVRGLAAPMGAIFSAVSIRVSGEIFDRTGGYNLLFAIFIGVQLLAAALMFATRFTSSLSAAKPAAAAT